MSATLALPIAVAVVLVVLWPEQWSALLRVGRVVDLGVAVGLWNFWPSALRVARAWLLVSGAYLVLVIAIWMRTGWGPLHIGHAFDPIVRFSSASSIGVMLFLAAVLVFQLTMLFRADVAALYGHRGPARTTPT